MGVGTAVYRFWQTMIDFIDRLSFGFGKTFSPIFQSESSECGLACLGMIARSYGHEVSLSELRTKFPQSLKGTTLIQLMSLAGELNLGSRPLKVDLDEIGQLRLPAILHWKFDHFVVLKEIKRGQYAIADPAIGLRRINVEEFSRSFTGVALEVWPSPQFETKAKAPPVSIGSLWGALVGLKHSLFRIFVMAACLELIALTVPLLTQWVIDGVLVTSDRDLLNLLVLGFLLVTIVQQIVSVTRYNAIMYFGTSLAVQWKAKVMDHLVKLPTDYFDKRHPGDIVSRFSTIEIIQRTVTLSAIEGVIDGFVAIATISLMLYYNAWMTAIPIGFMFLYAIGRMLRYMPLREATLEESIHGAKVSSHFLETLRGHRTIKIFVRQAERVSAWLSLLVTQTNANLAIQKIGIIFHSGNAIIAAVENILVIWIAANAVMDEKMTTGLFVAYLAYKNQFDSKITSLIDKFFEFKLLNVQMERLSDIVHTPQEGSLRRAWSSAELGDYSLQFSGVSFRYSPSDPFVLRDINFSVKNGESVCIVGPSGEGKSTLGHLILGLNPPTGGEIRIGGVPLAEVGLDGLRARVGAVLQDDVLFAGSIEENVSFFQDNPDLVWIKECCRIAKIDDDILKMPMGYRSHIGDLGTGLSGGQKQRLMLARALYKRPSILLLDEATSHLDPLNEKLINDEVRKLKITRIVIAHREETAATADRIVELREGRIFNRQSDMVSA